jgi:CubicO group peptidase (beta-lactamase class C family)
VGARRTGAVALVTAMVALALPAVAAAQSVDYSGVEASLSREIPEALAAGHTEGLSIALVDGGRAVWAQGFGWADEGAGVPVTADTLFPIGSSAKTMTAVAVMQLVEQGRVDLDAPISRYVPEFSLRPRFKGPPPTVRSALDMHSGIPGDVDNGLFGVGGPNPGYRDFLLRTLREMPAERPVDTAWAYSNSGYYLLQLVVENVSGQDLASYARDHLFAPMGMSSSTFDGASVPDAALAHPYAAVTGRTGAVRTRAQPREYCNAGGAGCAVSSAVDTAAYLKALIAGGAGPGGQILAGSTLQEMLTPQTRLPVDVVPFRMGLGWYVGDAPNAWMGRAAYWNGDTPSYHTFLRWLPDLGLGVFVSVNTTSPVAVRDLGGMRALELMVTAKTGRTPPPAPRPARVVRPPEAKLRRATGRWASGLGLDLVHAAHGALRWTPGAQRPGAATYTKVARANGWYAAVRPRAGDLFDEAWIRPATAGGRRLLLVRLAATPPAQGVTAAAERIPSSYRVPRAWRGRPGAYRASNLFPGPYPGAVDRAELALSHGVLVFSRSDGTAKVLVPDGPRRAFTFGFSTFAVQRGSGDLVTVDGKALSLLGTTFRRAG